MAGHPLVFWRGADGSGRLVFGDQGGAPVTPDAAFSIEAGLAGDGAARVELAAATRVEVDAGFADGFAGGAQLAWDANVSRGARAPLHAGWQQADVGRGALRAHWQLADALRLLTIARWQQGAPARAGVATVWQASERLRRVLHSGVQQGTPRRTGVAAPWQEAQRLRRAVRTHFQPGISQRADWRASWQEALRLRHAQRAHWQTADPRGAWLALPYADGLQARTHARPRWQEAWRPRAGRSRPPMPPPERPPCYDPARLGRLVFDAAHSGEARLVFVCRRAGSELPPALVIVPARRSYLVINSIEIRRLDDLAGPPLPSEAFSMTLDADSWTWSWSATFHRSARDAVTPSTSAPVELEAKVNGQPFRLLAERVGRSVRFPERLVKVFGRGLAALLDAPHAAVQGFGNTAARSAQQLMLDVLTINGVGIGWAVDWGLVDWQVPGNVWAHHGTWASALNDIAGAAGGYLQPHDTAQTLRVLPRWPTPWWGWATATPDLELPAGIAEVEDTEWIDKPAYNRIIVHGEAGGFGADIKRAGSAGDVLRAPAVHPLITAAEAAEQRGRAELADSGRLINQTLTLPVLPATGIIKPGVLLRYTDDDAAPRLGLVRSTAVNWGFPVLTQTIGVEGHA